MHSSLKDSAFQSDLSLECDLAQQIINYSAALLGIIILLCSSVSASLAAWQIASYLSNILVYREVHGQLNDFMLPRSHGYKISPNHYPSTTVLDS